MSELKFCCPACSQKIQYNEQWSGLKIRCPSCQAEIEVPRVAPAPAARTPPPPPAGHTKLTLAPSEHQTAPRSGPPPPPSRPRSAPPPPARRPQPEAHPSTAGKLLKLGVGVVVAGVVLYFGIGLARSWQAKFNKKSEQMAKNSDGGELGHAARLYQVLAETDPNRHELPSGAGPDASLAEARRVAHLGSGGRVSAGNGVPLQPPAWTLDLKAASIPGGRANGMISETRFVVDFAQITKVGQAYVLSLGQGTAGNPERDVMIYLHPNGGFSGHSWTVSPQMSGANVPQVIERWKTDPRYAAQQKLFKSGYAMRLQFGQLTADSLPGKIYLALPDGEQSVVAGSFELESAAPGMN